MEKMWYYVVGGKDKAGPVPESQLRSLVADGQVQSGDLVWAEGMAEWQPAGAVAELAGDGAPISAAAPTAAAMPGAGSYGVAAGGGAVPDGLCGWMTFVGVMNIIQGALACTSCIGAIVGIPMILAGAALMGAKSMLAELPQVSADIAPILDKIKRFMVMTGVVYIMGLVIFVIYIVFIIVLIAGGGFAAAMSEIQP